MAGYIGKGKAQSLTDVPTDIDHGLNIDGNVDVTGTATMDGLTVDSTSATIVNSSGNSELVIDTSNTGYGQINFKDSDATGRGKVRYDHTDNYMRFDTNGGERMRIDSAGRVTMPYQPAFSAAISSSSSTSTVTGIHIYDTVLSNVGGHYNSSNGTFTAPVAGSYVFTATVAWVEGGNCRYANIGFQKNSSLLLHRRDNWVSSGSGSSDYGGSTITGVIYLNANDTVRVYCASEQNNPLYRGDYSNSFTGFLLA
jgi:hypothetical protein